MKTSILSPDLDHLSKLKIQEATEVLGRLLWCEAGRLGLVNIFVSGNVNSGDGGIDAKAERVGGKGPHSFHYQIKTGTSFRPWQPAAISKELFGDANSSPSKSKLGSAVRHCLDSGGTYVMISLGHDLLADEHTSAVLLIQTSFRKCGYKNSNVEVWGVRQIANMMERYPSLCLDLNGLGDARFQTVGSWEKNGDMTPRISLGGAQRDFIQHVQGSLVGAEIQHVRVIGEPGIGKTRLVLEAIKALPLLSAKAIYVPQAEYFQSGALFFELLKDDREYSSILVIDECDEDDRASIFKALRGRPRIKLVTIDHGPDLTTDSLMEVVKFPPLEAPQIEEILRSYVGDAAYVHHWISWCEGSARVAHAVGDNLKRNPADILKAPAIVPIWERFVLGYNKVKGEQAERLMTIVRHIALFRKFGAKKPVEDEARFIATLASRVDPDITAGKFDIEVGKLAGRRILQGSHTFRLVPRALHVHLWKQWWEIHGPSANLSLLMDEMPETLRRWFLDMLIYSNGVASAQAAIQEVLGATDGAFTSKKFVASDSGSKFLNVMAEADPAATLAVFERTVGAWPRTEIGELAKVRQTLVFALEKIAAWEQHFQSAASLLVNLCFGEKNTNSNNARGTLKGLFYLRGAPTQANAIDRLNFVRKLLADSDSFNRSLGLELCEKFLSDHFPSRVIGVEYQGLAPPIAFWDPKTWGDLFGPRKEAMQLLLDLSDPTNFEWQAALSKVIIASADHLLRYKPLAEFALSVIRGQLDFVGGDGQALAKMLIHRLKHPYTGLPVFVTEELQAIFESTSTGPFSKRFDRFVSYDMYEESYALDSAGKFVESELPVQRIEALAQEFVDGEELRRQNLDTVIRSTGYRASDFGRRVAALSFGVVDLDSEIFERAAFLGDKARVGFLSGYLESLRRLDTARWERKAIDLLQEPEPNRWKVDSVVFSGFSPKVVARLLDLFVARAIDASRFLSAGWNVGEECLTTPEIEKICWRLNKSGDNEAARAAVQIASYRFAQKDGEGECSADLLWLLLMNPKVFRRNNDNMISYYWETLAKVFRKRFPERDIKLLRGIFRNHCRSGGPDSFSSVFDVIVEICRRHPKESWAVVARALENSERSWSISSWLGEPRRSESKETDGTRTPTPIDCFDPTQILDWIDEDKPSRADLIMQALPKSLEQGRGGDLTRGFIELFGPQSVQARSLIGQFYSGTRWGPDSVYYSKQRDTARTWIDSTTSSNVREWIGNFISTLSQSIERARIQEERGF